MKNTKFYVLAVVILSLQFLWICKAYSYNKNNCIKVCGQYQVSHCDFQKAVCSISSIENKTIYLKK